jgi:predicted DNA-binding transcriptional regulator YafY
MSLYNYLNRIQKLDALIRRKRTGTPKELAQKLEISERWLYIFMDELKQELGCPIKYDRSRRSYVYKEPGTLFLHFRKELSQEEGKQIAGGQIKKLNNFFHCIYMCSKRL